MKLENITEKKVGEIDSVEQGDIIEIHYSDLDNGESLTIVVNNEEGWNLVDLRDGINWFDSTPNIEELLAKINDPDNSCTYKKVKIEKIQYKEV